MPALKAEMLPNHIALLCGPADFTLQAAAVEGGPDPIPRFTMTAYTGEPMRVEGWRHPVVVDLEGLSIPSQRRPVRFGHSMHDGVGHTERISVEARPVGGRGRRLARHRRSAGDRGQRQAGVSLAGLDPRGRARGGVRAGGPAPSP